MIQSAKLNGHNLLTKIKCGALVANGLVRLALEKARYEWRKRTRDAPPEATEATSPAFRRLHLYDGGVYDNMGVEPFFDAGAVSIFLTAPIATAMSIYAKPHAAPTTVYRLRAAPQRGVVAPFLVGNVSASKTVPRQQS